MCSGLYVRWRIKRRGTLVVPVWRGMLVMPAEAEWIIQRTVADPTSGSLRGATDATSASLRAR